MHIAQPVVRLAQGNAGRLEDPSPHDAYPAHAAFPGTALGGGRQAGFFESIQEGGAGPGADGGPIHNRDGKMIVFLDAGRPSRAPGDVYRRSEHFPADASGGYPTRLQLGEAKVLITADGGYRNAEVVPYKEKFTDQALDNFVPRERALSTLSSCSFSSGMMKRSAPFRVWRRW